MDRQARKRAAARTKSFKNAVAFIQQAIKADGAKIYDKAYQNYRAALDHFNMSLQCTNALLFVFFSFLISFICFQCHRRHKPEEDFGAQNQNDRLPATC